MSENPYVLYPDNVDIAREKQCYIIIENPEDRPSNYSDGMRYSIHDFTPEEASLANTTSGGNVYMTHNYTCGVCSSLVDLKVFMTQTDLTTPVKSCIVKNMFKLWDSEVIFRQKVAKCFEETIGFT